MKNLKIKIMEECFRSGNGQNIGLAEKWLAWVISKAELEPNFETEKGIVTLEGEIPEEWAEKQTQTKDKFKEVKEAFARGEEIEFSTTGKDEDWWDASAPAWVQYRVKPKHKD